MRFCRSHDLTPEELVELRAMLDGAFDGDFDDHDFQHALGGTHVLAYDADPVRHGRGTDEPESTPDGALRTAASRGAIVGHASVVGRTLTVDDALGQGAPSSSDERAPAGPKVSRTGPVTFRTGYVEGVGVASSHRRRGIGAALMSYVEDEIARSYELGVLAASPSGMSLYTSRGWAPWTGELAAENADGRRSPTPDEFGSILVWLTGPSTSVDVDRLLVVDHRSGAQW